MAKSNLSHSLRKFIRREKARLRREVLHPEEAEARIKELVSEIFEQYNKSIKNNKRLEDGPKVKR